MQTVSVSRGDAKPSLQDPNNELREAEAMTSLKRNHAVAVAEIFASFVSGPRPSVIQQAFVMASLYCTGNWPKYRSR